MGSSRRLLIDLLRRQRRRVLLAFVLSSIWQICEALVPVAIGLVIDQAVSSGEVGAMVWSVLGVFALFSVLTFSARGGGWLISKAVLWEAHRLRLEVVTRVISGRGVRTKRQSGELLSISTSDTQASAELLEAVVDVLVAVIGLVVTAVLLLRIDWVLGLGLLLGIPLLVLGLNLLGPLVERRTSTQQQAIGLAAATASDLLAGLRPLRGFGGVTEAVRRYRTTSRTSLGATVGAVKAGAIFLGVSTFATGLLLAAVAAAAGWFALQGRITVGELITIVGLAAFLTDPVQNLGRAVFQFATSRASAVRVGELLDAPTLAADGDRRPATGATTLELRDVTTPGLDRVNLSVGPGEMVGLVTQSIVSADSLTELLAGRTEPSAGQVLLGDEPLGEIDVAALRRLLLVEPHASAFFGTTLREVLQTGATAADDRPDVDLERVLVAAGAADLTQTLGGLDAELLDHGDNLSGGQRQRVAVARALLADRPLLALRDPTTAVDGVTEHAMADGIRSFRCVESHSTVLITTSAPLLARCDRVLLISRGRVAATGRHADLLEHAAYAEAVLR